MLHLAEFYKYGYYFLTIGLSLTGQVLLKRGLHDVLGDAQPGLLTFLRDYGLASVTNLQMIVGVILCGFAFIAWVYVLSIYDLSRALPLLGGFALLISFVVGIAVLNEPVHWINATGIVVLLTGIYLVSWKAAPGLITP